MRWSSLVLAACTHAAAPPPPPPAPPAPACPVVARACDASIGDTDAVALAQQRCVPCHHFNDAGALRARPVAAALATCEMPPRPHVLDPAERARLVAWASCGTSGALAR